MLKTSCEPCRNKKVKCDGGFPECSTCRKSRRSIPCTYELSQRDKKTLRVGEACTPCRRRKKRCDGRRPTCDACRNRKAEECVYEKSEADFQVHHSDDKDGRGIKISSWNPKSRLESVRLKPPSPSTELVAVSPTNMFLVPSGSRRQTSPDLDAIRMNLFLSFPQASFPSTSSFKNNQPRLTLEDIGDPYAFALTDVSLADLNMKFRVIFLQQRFANGIYLSTTKQQALILGDLSNTTIHSFFVHFAHLVGCHMYQEFQGRFSLLYIQAIHLRLALEALATMVEEDDPFSLARAYHFMAMAYAYTRNVRYSKHCLRKSVDIIQRRKIRCVAITVGDLAQREPNILPPVPPFTEEVHERVAFLAQMLYAGTFVYLVGQPEGFELGFDDGFDFGLPELYSDTHVKGYPEEISLDLEWQFRYELPNAYPILFEICPIVLRVRSIILYKDANNIIAWYHKQSTPSSPWFSTCRVFLLQLRSHIDSLTKKIGKSTNTDDGKNRTTLQFSSILSLTTIAQVYHVLANNQISAQAAIAEFRYERNDALRRVLAIVDDLDPVDFQFMDPFLGICWSRAITLFTKESPLSTSPTAITCLTPADTSSLTSIWSSLPTTTDASATSTNATPPPPPPPLVPRSLSQLLRDDREDFETSVARIARLYDNYIQNRFLPGTTSLCAMLDAQSGDKRKKPE